VTCLELLLKCDDNIFWPRLVSRVVYSFFTTECETKTSLLKIIGMPVFMHVIQWFCMRWIQEYQGIELCAKLLFQTELIRTRRDQEFGFTVEAKVADSSFQSDELCVFVSDVAKGGPVAQKKGLNRRTLYLYSISVKFNFQSDHLLHMIYVVKSVKSRTHLFYVD